MVPRLMLLIALYLMLDVANPLMPGALTFDAESSVEARLVHHSRVDDVATASTPAPERLRPAIQRPFASIPAVSGTRTRLPHCARPRRSCAPPAASVEDD